MTEAKAALTPLTYRVDEAAALLGVSKNACYEAAQRGELPSIRVGRRILIPRHALAKMLEAA